MNKWTSAILVMILALAGSFCYAECVFAAVPQTEQACHHEPSAQPSEHSAELMCCPEFVAQQGSRIEVSPALTQVSDLFDVTPGVVLAARLPEQATDLSLSVDLSPPQVFTLTHFVHAPPFSI